MKKKRIALLVETSLGSGRNILRGIASYAHSVNDWQLHHGAAGFLQELPAWIRQWEGEAVIARIHNDRIRVQLEELKVPVVDVLGLCESSFPLVHVDDDAIANLVTEHFVDRNFSHVGFYGISNENWSVRRRDSFQKHWPSGQVEILEISRSSRNSGYKNFDRIQKWLRNLPKPIGIFVCSDQIGFDLLEACAAERISVPEEISVVGVDDDDTLCEISNPPLTSIKGGHYQVGVVAAQLADRLIEGESVDQITNPILVPPTGITERLSSQSNAIEDSVVARGVRFIRENIAESITNDSIAKSLGISRTLFQKRFRDETGKTVRELILEMRIERAVFLLRNTDLTMLDIAQRSGFKRQEYMGQVIKKKTGKTPGQVRSE